MYVDLLVLGFSFHLTREKKTNERNLERCVDVAGMRDRERNLWVSVLSVRVSLMTAR